jgi:hypothetical protein
VPAGRDQPVVSFQPGRLKIGDQWVPLESAPVKPGSGAVAVAGSRVYATAAAATGRPSGFWVSLGTPTTYRQQILWICERVSCRRHPLDVRPDTGGRELLAVGPDGRVLLVRPDRLTLVTPR